MVYIIIKVSKTLKKKVIVKNRSILVQFESFYILFNLDDEFGSYFFTVLF